MKTEMVTAYKTKGQTVFGKMPYIYSGDDYRANNKPLNKTFLDGWFQVDGDLESLVQVLKVKVNERYELINKDLYNEKIPLVIDDSTKEKFKSLLDSELYKWVYDTKEEFTDIPFEVIEVDTEQRFDIKTAKEFNPRPQLWNDRKQHYIIQLLEHSPVDMCLIPRPLLDLTRPCKLAGENLYNVLTDMVAVKLPKNCRIVNNDAVFEVKNMTKSNRLIYWNNFIDERKQTFGNIAIFGNSYDDLMGRLNAFVNYVIQKLSDYDARAIEIAIDEMAQGKDFREVKE